MRLYVCYKYKNNNLYHVSKEDVKWLSYLGVKYYLFHIWFDYWFHNNIIGLICLKNLQWIYLFPFVDSIFLCSLLTRHFNSQYLKTIVSIFFSVFDLMNCCKFQKPMMNQYWKRVLLNKKYETSKHKMMFYVNKNNICKVMLFNILLVLTS